MLRLGQTSAIQFGSKILISAVGFISTLYFARVVGADTLGTYFLLLSLMAGLSILIEAGVSQSITKRMSEGNAPGAYFIVGGSVIAAFYVLISLGLLSFAGPLNRYTGSELSHLFLLALIGGSTAMTLSNAGLNGSHNVHISGVLNGVQTILRVSIQVATVSIGLGLVGLVAGWAAATVTTSAIGLLYLSRTIKFPAKPTVEEFRRRVKDLYGYARYSWLGSIKGKTNNYADIIILGLFVPNGLIGVYAISWNIASFLTIFGASIQETLFPAISHVSAEGDRAEIAQLINHSLRFTGLFVIPGLVGGVLLGPRILRLYGPEFEIGTAVLYLLIVAVLLFDYQKQLTSTLNGMDRPQLAFRANAMFIVTNIFLNFVLVAQFGWVGAAVATAASSGFGLAYSLVLTKRLIPFKIPVVDFVKQIAASVVMGLVVIGLLWVESTYGLVNSNFIVVGTLVGLGGAVYLGLIVVLSREIRAAVLRNLGFDQAAREW